MARGLAEKRLEDAEWDKTIQGYNDGVFWERNTDLWERLQVQLDRHSVTLEWVRGHNGHAENERCDELARSQSARHDLPEDTGYEPE